MENALHKQTSPYLLQHADNPVHWQAWGPEAFAKAKADNKPILLSVGYAACHWCHVMAHESFEDKATAELMNTLFVNIKVDREERPDVDAIYQTALALLGERGGWPLTMFLTPDGAPFWGGTYFPPDSRFGRPGFPTVLGKVDEVWREKADMVAKNVSVMSEALQKTAR
ncbi:MAG: thioredoxin domain-containing protein, partial [Alphaproteobacteria bacterium]